MSRVGPRALKQILHMPIIAPQAPPRTPATGVFYLVLTPRGWRLLGWRYDEYPSSMDHSHFWETEVCPYLANFWVAQVRRQRPEVSCEWLRAALIGHYTAFPRGRVAEGEKGLAVYWGENFPAKARHLKSSIGNYFGLPICAPWIRDDHERCLNYDYKAVRRHVPIRQIWRTEA